MFGSGFGQFSTTLYGPVGQSWWLFRTGLAVSAAACGAGDSVVPQPTKKAAGKRKAVLKYKELAAAVAKIDAKKSVGIAVIASAGFGLDADLKKVGGKVVETPVKQMISQDGIDSINGSIHVTEDITGSVTVGVRGAAVAKDVAKVLQEDLNDGIDLILRALFKYPKLGPVAEFIKAINVTVKDNRTVTIQANVTAKQVADALK